MRAPRRLAAAIPLLVAVVAAGCSTSVPIEAATSAPTSVGTSAPGATDDVSSSDVDTAVDDEVAADPAPTVVPERSSEQQSASSITWIGDVDFNNGFIYDNLVGWSDQTVTVADGFYENGAFGDDDYFWFGVTDVHIGDLDGDGADDAVVATTWNGGGTGWFDAVAAYRLVDGTAQQAGTVPFGDRADGGIFASEIDGGIARVWAFSGGEGACCPTQIAETRLLLGSHSLVAADTLASKAWLSLDTYGEPDAVRAVSFLPGTSSAAVAVASDLDTAVFSVEAGQGQILQVDTTTGPLPDEVSVTNTATAETFNADSPVTLPDDAIYEVSVTFDDIERGDQTMLDVSIVSAIPAARVNWNSAVEQTVVTSEPDVFSSLVWPVFVSERPGTDAANQELEAFVLALDDAWIEGVRNESGDGADPLDDSTYDLSYSVTLLTDEIVSVRFNYYDYVCCRPYPNYGPRSMVLDLVTGQQLEVGEILDVTRLDQITNIWIEEHVAQNAGGPDEVAQILATGPRFDSWTLVPDGIEFGTDRNGFGGGSSGTETTVTFEQLGDLVNPGLVARLSAG